MTSYTGFVMTLANSIIGVSLLAMPYCFKQCGLVLGVLLLLASNITTRLACHYLVKSAVMCRRKSFEYVAYHAFGSSGKLLVELGVIGFMMGTSVAFFVVMGDLAPAIISKMFEFENDETLRTYVLIVTGVFVVLPLSLLRNIESLAAISTVTMLFYLSLVFKVFVESFPQLAAGSWTSRVAYWQPEGVLQCFPIFAMALSCQTQIYEILEVLPNPTSERMNDVVKAAVSLCTCLYIAVGFFGYIAYARDNFGGNILLSFNPSLMSDLFQLGFVISIALSFPIVVFPCRASLNSLLFKKGSQYQELSTQSTYISDGRFKMLTGVIVGIALCTGLLIPSIEFVLGFVGSTIGVATCIIFPASAFINISNKETSERQVAKVMLVLGIFAMILGTFGNLHAAVDRSFEPSINLVQPLKPVVEEPKILQPSPKSEAADSILPAKEESPKKLDPPDSRKEPPVPVQRSSEQDDQKVKAPINEVIVKESPPTQSSKVPPPLEAQKEIKEIPKPAEIDPPIVNLPNVAEEVDLKSKIVVKEEAKDSKIPVANSLPNENVKKPDVAIHDDAIAREELQLKEDDTLQKSAVEKKEAELLQTLKEHKEEQIKLLAEQQNILNEIKSLDGKKAEEAVIPIQPKKFSENIEKIQEVIDELKERKQEMDKTNVEKIAEDKKRNIEKKSKLNEKGPGILKAIVPLMLNNTPSLAVDKKIEPNVGNRDILAVEVPHNSEREKREVNNVVEESCVKIEEPKGQDLVQKAEEISLNLGTSVREAKRLSEPAGIEVKRDQDLIVESKQPTTELLQGRDETRRK